VIISTLERRGEILTTLPYITAQVLLKTERYDEVTLYSRDGPTLNPSTGTETATTATAATATTNTHPNSSFSPVSSPIHISPSSSNVYTTSSSLSITYKKLEVESM